MREKTMWFVSAHTPTSEQIEDAKKMGYTLIHVPSPVLRKDSDVVRLWNEIFTTHPIREGDAIVVMGEPRWIAAIVRMHTYDSAYYDGFFRRACFTNSDGERVCMANITLMTAFTERQSVETTLPDGSVVKKSVFRHGGFVPL